MAEVLNLKRMVQQASDASNATRHASTITAADLDALAKSLCICFVPCHDEALDVAAATTYDDLSEVKWEEHKHEEQDRVQHLQEVEEQACHSANA